MPIAAILRAGRPSPPGTHTPDRPSTRPVLQPERGAHRDQRILKAANEIHHVERLGQPDDRIADQLAGAVPGDLAAAVGVDHRACRRPGARAVRCACPRCRPADARAAAGCRGRRRRGRRRARAAAARPRCSRRCPAGARRAGATADRIDAVRHVFDATRIRCPSERWRRPAPRRWCCGGTRIRRAPAPPGWRAARRAGPRRRTRRARCAARTPAPAAAVGRFTARPSAAVNSALVTGAGPVRFTGTGEVVVTDREQQRADLVLEADPRHVLAAVAQPRAEPEREQRLEAAQHAARRATAPARCAPAPPGRPPAAADSVAASQSSHSPARKPRPGGRRLVDDAVAGVAVVADRAGVDQHGHAGFDDGARQHLGGADAAVAQALFERARPALGADVDAAQVHHGVDAAQRARVELAGVGIPEQLVGVRRRPPHDAQHPVVGRAQRGRQRRADQSGGTRDRDDGMLPRCRLYRPRSASNAPSSSRRLMVVRKRPASAPSIRRWS